MSRTITHIGFSDESHWNTGRFRSLGLVTLSISELQGIENRTRALLKESDIQEFKWKKVDGAKERFAAEKMCTLAVDYSCKGCLRVDVLVWDTEDSRHNIQGRDDVANLERMYYHLFRNVMRARWPDDAVWKLCPDEHGQLKWDTVRDCLTNVSTSIEVERSLLTGGEFKIRLRTEFGIEEIQPVSSHDHPLLQLADLFAGLAVFSREKFDEFKNWRATNSQQGTLWDCADTDKCPSRSSIERFQVLRQFDRLCKDRKLGVGLNGSKGLLTRDPWNPINFWLYQPQHPYDKAPRKARQ
jgi:hypothetical protein